MRLDFGKIADFASAELASLPKSQINFSRTVQNGREVITAANWTITVHSQDHLLCARYLCDPVIFHSKTCAIIYVVNNIRNNIPNSIEIESLDNEIYRLKTTADLLKLKMHRQLRQGNIEAFGLLNNKYTEVAARLNAAIAKIKKYCYLTKYNKGITL